MEEGINLREFYAGLAMQGLSTQNRFHKDDPDFVEWCCKLSAQMADRLIKELDKREEE